MDSSAQADAEKSRATTRILYNNIHKASPYKLEAHTQLSAAYSDNCELFKARTSFFRTEY